MSTRLTDESEGGADTGKPKAPPPHIRPFAAGDKAWLHGLNQACLPKVNDLSEAALWALQEKAACAWVAESATTQRPLGAMIALDPMADYDSPNFLWFRDHFASFIYIDRVMVEDAARNAGVGMALYRHLILNCCGDGWAALTCEVNMTPPNPASLRFHEHLGFARVGEQDTDGGAKHVVLLRKPLR